MQRLFLLTLLMGGLALFTCDLYEFKFSSSTKSWNEARSFCRRHHTDLATVYDLSDNQRLGASTQSRSDSWIGLRKGNIKSWHWSLPGEMFNRSQIKYSGTTHQNCMAVHRKDLETYQCNHKLPFFCYNETNQQPVFIDEHYTWSDAQKHCRNLSLELLSGHENLESLTSQPREFAWIGLFKDEWVWSDGSNFSFRHWNDECIFTSQCGEKKCSMITKSGTWAFEKCEEKKQFFCYDDKLILVRKRKTWQEALDYCRDKHDDLVSIADLHDHRWVQERAKGMKRFIWLGLHYTNTLGFWFWVNGEKLTFTNWAPHTNLELCYTGRTAVAMDPKNDFKWVCKSDVNTFEFICVK